LISAHLDGKLIEKYNIRSFPLRKGDTVKIIRGDKKIKGFETKVTEVNIKKGTIIVDGVTIAKADKKQVERPIQPSNVIITKLDLSDTLRRKRLEKLAKIEIKVEEEEEEKVEEEVKEEEIEEVEEEVKERKKEEKKVIEEVEGKEEKEEEKKEEKNKQRMEK
jgi:large subunit ribosomal protein L24